MGFFNRLLLFSGLTMFASTGNADSLLKCVPKGLVGNPGTQEVRDHLSKMGWLPFTDVMGQRMMFIKMDPKDATWECERDRRIARAQGQHNHFIKEKSPDD